MEPELTLSVIVSCYKQEAYIADCLHSILNQQVDFDYEIIVSDDCSPDSTPLIIEEIARAHPEKFKLFLNKVNVGAAKNYMSAHKRAKGKYVAHIDGDDIMLPGKLQAEVDVMENNSDCNIVFHRSRYFNDDRTYESDTGKLFSAPLVVISPQQLARWGTIAAHGTYMYRRSARQTIESTQEFMEWFYAFEFVADGGVAAYINTIYLEYRCNPSGSAYLASRAGRAKSYGIIIKHVSDYFEQYPQFRADLYAHQLVNIAMSFKNDHKLSWNSFSFLAKNIAYFRLSKFVETIKVRSMVGPAVKIR